MDKATQKPGSAAARFFKTIAVTLLLALLGAGVLLFHERFQQKEPAAPIAQTDEQVPDTTNDGTSQGEPSERYTVDLEELWRLIYPRWLGERAGWLSRHVRQTIDHRRTFSGSRSTLCTKEISSET